MKLPFLRFSYKHTPKSRITISLHWHTCDIITFISFALFVISFLAILWGYTPPLRESTLSITSNFHIRINDTAIFFFNDSTYGPYRGSAIMGGPMGTPYPTITAWGHSYGIYFRHLRWPTSTLWTLAISLLYPLLLTSILPFIQWLRWQRQPRSDFLCPHCSYDLRASPTRCPECGNLTPPRKPPEK